MTILFSIIIIAFGVTFFNRKSLYLISGRNFLSKENREIFNEDMVLKSLGIYLVILGFLFMIISLFFKTINNMMLIENIVFIFFLILTAMEITFINLKCKKDI